MSRSTGLDIVVRADGKEFVWPGAPRRRPTGDQDSLCWTGKDRKSKIVWPGAPRQRPTGDQDSLCWTGKDIKGKMCGREALADIRREENTRGPDG